MREFSTIILTSLYGMREEQSMEYIAIITLSAVAVVIIWSLLFGKKHHKMQAKEWIKEFFLDWMFDIFLHPDPKKNRRKHRDD